MQSQFWAHSINSAIGSWQMDQRKSYKVQLNKSRSTRTIH